MTGRRVAHAPCGHTMPCVHQVRLSHTVGDAMSAFMVRVSMYLCEYVQVFTGVAGLGWVDSVLCTQVIAATIQALLLLLLLLPPPPPPRETKYGQVGLLVGILCTGNGVSVCSASPVVCCSCCCCLSRQGLKPRAPAAVTHRCSELRFSRHPNGWQTAGGSQALGMVPTSSACHRSSPHLDACLTPVDSPQADGTKCNQGTSAFLSAMIQRCCSVPVCRWLAGPSTATPCPRCQCLHLSRTAAANVHMALRRR